MHVFLVYHEGLSLSHSPESSVSINYIPRTPHATDKSWVDLFRQVLSICLHVCQVVSLSVCECAFVSVSLYDSVTNSALG